MRQGLQDFARVRETARGQVFSHQGFFKHKANRLIIVHNPNRFHKFTSPVVSCWLLWLVVFKATESKV
jgi:hypothetical protein